MDTTRRLLADLARKGNGKNKYSGPFGIAQGRLFDSARCPIPQDDYRVRGSGGVNFGWGLVAAGSCAGVGGEAQGVDGGGEA